MEAGWSLAAGMLYKTYQIAMDGKIYDPTEVCACLPACLPACCVPCI